MRWTCCMSHVVIATTHYTVFVLPQLLICLTKQAYGLALPLPGHGPEPRMRSRCPWGLARWERAQKRAVFTSLDIRVYIRKYCHWTGEEHLCRRMDLSPAEILEVDHARQRRTMNTVHSAEESQEKMQKWSRSWPCKATTDDEHCTKLSSFNEHGYTCIHWMSSPMDRGRIVLREKVTENAPLATLFEEEVQEKPEVDCVLQHEPARRKRKSSRTDRAVWFSSAIFFNKNGLVNSYLNRNW